MALRPLRLKELALSVLAGVVLGCAVAIGTAMYHAAALHG